MQVAICGAALGSDRRRPHPVPLVPGGSAPRARCPPGLCTAVCPCVQASAQSASWTGPVRPPVESAPRTPAPHAVGSSQLLSPLHGDRAAITVLLSFFFFCSEFGLSLLYLQNWCTADL